MDQKPKLLDSPQQQALLEMLYRALLDIRSLGWAGNSEQAADLADAFHNLPLCMGQDDFDILFFRDSFLACYQRSWPGATDYLAMIDRVIAMED